MRKAIVSSLILSGFTGLVVPALAQTPPQGPDAKRPLLLALEFIVA